MAFTEERVLAEAAQVVAGLSTEMLYERAPDEFILRDTFAAQRYVTVGAYVLLKALIGAVVANSNLTTAECIEGLGLQLAAHRSGLT